MANDHRRAPYACRLARRTTIFAATAALVAAGALASDVSAKPKPQTPLGSMHAVVDQIGARALWERGITGADVNVAVIDTGVAPVPALSGDDKVVAVVDLSGEGDTPALAHLDGYGHGTHMAGIIAGRDPGADPALAAEHPEWFLGVAPDAGIVSVKVAGHTGAVDITQVIAGVDWVVEHADELEIDVLNLSYSSGSTLGYEHDPLAAAVERAWNAGIVVVAAAGNDGRAEQRLAAPANDPFVIAVAAAEAKQNGTFTVPSWATRGDGTRNPDVAAPGAHIDSLRVPGSVIDVEHPEGFVSDALFRGSGSSQAAAVVSGAAALLLDARPDLTPDQVKALLASDTAPVLPELARFSGSGLIQLAGLVDAPTPDGAQTWPTSDGDGALEAARGGQHVVFDGLVVRGEITVLGTTWEGARWSGARWSSGEWDGARWSAGDWLGARWSSASWAGARWSGASWSGASWTGASWSDASWSGARWSGASWSGASWSDESWTGASWSGAHWSGARWSGARWG